MRLKTPIESTSAASNQSWITPSIIFIAGWWKSARKGTRTPWANTLTRRPRAINNRTHAAHFFGCSENAVLFCLPMARILVALILIIGLSFGSAFDVLAQSSTHKHKSKKPKVPPCQTGCQPDTSAPQVAAHTPEGDAAQRELSDLALALHNRTPGS